MRRAPSRTRLARFPRRPALLVADPSPLFLRGIAHVGALAGAEVATASAPAALELRARARPQHVLLANPGLWPCDGWGWLGELRAHRKAPVGILVEHGRRWEMERAIGLGYDAYIDKRWLTSLLLPTVIRTLLAGGLVYLAGDREPHGDVTSLTLREFEVLQFLRDGLSVGDIARRLYLSERTVKAAITSATRRLGAVNRVQAVARGYEFGLLSPSPWHLRQTVGVSATTSPVT